MKPILLLHIFFVLAALANAQTIPKSIDKPATQKPPKAKQKPLHKVVVKAEKKIGWPEMVYIPGGTFSMGRENGSADEKPVHQVTVSSFYMSKYEITEAQWREVMDENHVSCPNCPVYNASWEDIQQFLEKLNAKTGKNYRLPREAEWEYAARGGQNYTYAGSNNIGEVAWYSANGNGETHPVGQKLPNGYGLYDMTGNVLEWCNDWYSDSYYSNSVNTNPTGPSSGVNRVLRGGNWNYTAVYSPVTFRNQDRPGRRLNTIGFRVVVPK